MNWGYARNEYSVFSVSLNWNSLALVGYQNRKYTSDPALVSFLLEKDICIICSLFVSNLPMIVLLFYLSVAHKG